MLTRRFQILAALGVSTVVATLSGAGCDLNPQPLPPGETAEDSGAPASLGSGGGTGDAGSSTFAADAGGITPPVSGEDAGATGSEADGAAPGAGDAAAADATSDASSEDASPDAQTDAPVDAGDGGDW